jgi:hypothetical protein
MPRVTSNLVSFSAGEISPQLFGRIDVQKYQFGCRTLENFIARVHGGAQRRPGTYFVAEVKSSSKFTRLIPFEYSITQAYIIEVGDLYFRFFREYGRIESPPGTPVEVVTPYLEADLRKIMYAQDQDTMYICCDGYKPKDLTRSSHTAWTFADHVFNDGPYLEENSDSDHALAPTALTGAGITLVSSKDLFDAGHIDAYFRLRYGTTTPSWGYCKITAVTDAKHATATVKRDFSNNYVNIEGLSNANPCVVTHTGHGLSTDDTVMFVGITQANWTALNQIIYTITKIDANSYSVAVNTTTFGAYAPGTDPGTVTSGTKLWREGAFSTYRGWPAACIFHEQRLYYFKDSYVHASKTGDPTDFGTGTAATPLATDGFSYEIASDKVNVIRWANSLSNLMIGTSGGIWRMGAQSSNEPITAINAKIMPQSPSGSAMIRPQGVGHSILYVERLGLPTNNGERINELSYDWQMDAYKAKDMTLLAEHITRGGIVDWDFQRSPYPILWAVRYDGVLIGLTYEKDQDVFGWHRHITDGEVEAVACIPGDIQDDLWLIVNRTINGATKRYVEYLKPWNWGTSQFDCFYVDCGLTYSGTEKAVSGATKASPVVITATAHGFSNGNYVRISGVVGMTELNDKIFEIANVAANTFELKNINGTSYTTYVSGGIAKLCASSVTGLSHLEGKTVAILGDGAVQIQKTVASGSVTLTRPASVVHVGLSFTSTLDTLDLEGGGAEGPAHGKRRRISKVVLRLNEAGSGLEVGYAGKRDVLDFRIAGNPMDAPVPLFSGIYKDIVFPSHWTKEAYIKIIQGEPLPLSVLSIIATLKTEDA